MGQNNTVYNKLIQSPNECLRAIQGETGIKINCMPFAVKVVEALKDLNIRTEQDALKAANVLMAGLQTLWQGGITAEDYDKIDFVKRSNTIVPSARVEAFLRAAARKGYRITDTIVAVPKEDSDTTYFKENFYNGDIVYTLEDMRKNPDRAVTAQRLIGGYFGKFICRLDVHDVDRGKRVAMSVCEMSNDEMLNVSSVSEQGLYKSEWVIYTNKWGNEKKKKVISEELNSESFWCRWTGEMVNKTIIRRALKRIREVLPELKDAIYAFDNDDYTEAEEVKVPEEPIAIPSMREKVELNKLTPEQVQDCSEIYELFVANPKLAEDKFGEIKARVEQGEDRQQIINEEYASIITLMRSKTYFDTLRGYFIEEDKT